MKIKILRNNIFLLINSVFSGLFYSKPLFSSPCKLLIVSLDCHLIVLKLRSYIYVVKLCSSFHVFTFRVLFSSMSLYRKTGKKCNQKKVSIPWVLF